MDFSKSITAILQSRVLVYVVIGLVGIKVVTIGLQLPFPSNIFFADITKSDLVRLLNEHRQKAGVTTLTESQVLNQAARLKAEDMIKNGYFAHESPQGVTPWFWFVQAGYAYAYAGENLAVGFADSAAMYNAWVDSPSHKANLLNPNFQEVGTAIVQGFGNNGATVVVQLFGSPKPVAAVHQNVNINPQSTKTNLPPVEPPVPPPVDQPSPGPAPQPKDRVLAQSTEYVIGNSQNATIQNTWYARFVHVLLYNNEAVVNQAIYAALVLLGLCTAAGVRLNMRREKPLALARPFVLLAILAVSSLVSTEWLGNLLNANAII